ncbi:hypothetical protein Q763_13935 [Flavobacterium beibuense F44-8]|uniref:Uncharacterized protein n=1 Tax=Flavobacterium beibuense F44-8 TaxID=1406840 RepID=A0A0A2LJH1_9FLAO|nr:hypothetical protein Q763_13935 [Flavobacterium beibuense F44-8]
MCEINNKLIFKNIVLEFIKWLNIAILSNNKIFVKSYICLIVIPILVCMLNKLKTPFEASLKNDYILIIDLQLQFN